MKVREVMTTVAHTCRPEDTLECAAQLLWSHDCGVLPVVDGEGRVQAMITDRDICMGAWSRGQPLAGLRVADSMSRDVVSCQADEDLAAATGKMVQRQVRRLPVVDAQGRIAGILSLNDLAGRSDQVARTEVLKVLAAVCQSRAKSPVLEPRRAQSAPARQPQRTGATAG